NASALTSPQSFEVLAPATYYGKDNGYGQGNRIMNNYDLPRPHISTTLPFSVHSWPRDSVAADSAAEQGVFNDEPAVHFNAFNCEPAFLIGVSSDVEYALLPALMHRLRVEAP